MIGSSCQGNFPINKILQIYFTCILCLLRFMILFEMIHSYYPTMSLWSPRCCVISMLVTYIPHERLSQSWSSPFIKGGQLANCKRCPIGCILQESPLNIFVEVQFFTLSSSHHYFSGSLYHTCRSFGVGKECYHSSPFIIWAVLIVQFW